MVGVNPQYQGETTHTSLAVNQKSFIFPRLFAVRPKYCIKSEVSVLSVAMP